MININVIKQLGMIGDSLVIFFIHLIFRSVYSIFIKISEDLAFDRELAEKPTASKKEIKYTNIAIVSMFIEVIIISVFLLYATYKY